MNDFQLGQGFKGLQQQVQGVSRNSNSFSKAVPVLLALVSSGCLAGFSLADAGKSDQAPKEEEPVQKRVWYQLVNVTIPPDSPHRNNKDLEHPPKLFVIFKKKGEEITRGSSWNTGWSVDFPEKYQNQWPVREGTADRYTVEVWDYNRVWDSKQIFAITGLKGEDFRKVMKEKGGSLTDEERLSTIEWKKIEEPAK